MDPQDEIAIPLSKAQTVKLIASGLVMVGCAMLLYINQASLISTLPWTRNSPVIAAIFSYFTLFAALLFAIGTGFIARKLFDTRPALVFSSAGITDNASGVAAGFIPWADIAGIGVYQQGRYRALTVNLVDPEKYVARGGLIRRWVNRVNLRMGGSPVYIPATVMPIEFEKLVELFSTQLAKYRAETLIERVSQQRDHYQSLLRNRVRTLRSSQSRLATELLIEPNNSQSSRPFSLIRVDAIYGPSEAPKMERVVSGRAMPTGVQRQTLDCGITISAGPVSWESTCFAFHSQTFQMSLLSEWLNEWLDVEGVKEQDSDGLRGVVHSCTGVLGDDFRWQLTTDFGSAPMAAFDQLVALLARNGVRDCSLAVPDDA